MTAAPPGPFASISVFGFLDGTNTFARDCAAAWIVAAKERLATMQRTGEKAPAGAYTLVNYGHFFGAQKTVDVLIVWAKGIPGLVHAGRPLPAPIEMTPHRATQK